jgi:hypothetical protein
MHDARQVGHASWYSTFQVKLVEVDVLQTADSCCGASLASTAVYPSVQVSAQQIAPVVRSTSPCTGSQYQVQSSL